MKEGSQWRSGIFGRFFLNNTMLSTLTPYGKEKVYHVLAQYGLGTLSIFDGVCDPFLCDPRQCHNALFSTYYLTGK